MGGGSVESWASLTFCLVVRFFLLFIIMKAVPRAFLLNKILNITLNITLMARQLLRVYLNSILKPLKLHTKLLEFLEEKDKEEMKVLE